MSHSLLVKRHFSVLLELLGGADLSPPPPSLKATVEVDHCGLFTKFIHLAVPMLALFPGFSTVFDCGKKRYTLLSTLVYVPCMS